MILSNFKSNGQFFYSDILEFHSFINHKLDLVYYDENNIALIFVAVRIHTIIYTHDFIRSNFNSCDFVLTETGSFRFISTEKKLLMSVFRWHAITQKKATCKLKEGKLPSQVAKKAIFHVKSCLLLPF